MHINGPRSCNYFGPNPKPAALNCLGFTAAHARMNSGMSIVPAVLVFAAVVSGRVTTEKLIGEDEEPKDMLICQVLWF